MTSTEASAATPRGRTGFRQWARSRPFVGGLLVVLGGVELFFSGQLDLGNIQIQFGIEGLQATIIPFVMVLLGVLCVTMPQHRIFYGVIALALSVYSLIGVNLGGFMIGMLLSTIGGILAVSWMPREQRPRRSRHAQDVALAAPPLDQDARLEWIASIMTYPVRVPSTAETDLEDAPEPPPFVVAPHSAHTEDVKRARASRVQRIVGRAGAVAIVTVASLTLSAVVGGGRALAAEPASNALCIPLLMRCDPPTPAPTVTPTPTAPSSAPADPTDPLGGLVGGLTGGDTTGGPLTDPGTTTADPGITVPGVTDPGTPVPPVQSTAPTPEPTGTWGPTARAGGSVFTLPAQRMTTQSLSFTGIPLIGLVTVPLANGDRATVIRLSADSITMTGYALEIRREAGGPSAVETDASIVLTGHVVVYLDSLTAAGLTLATDTPPPASDQIPSSLLGASFGLVGATANHMDRNAVHLQVNG